MKVWLIFMFLYTIISMRKDSLVWSFGMIPREWGDQVMAILFVREQVPW